MKASTSPAARSERRLHVAVHPMRSARAVVSVRPLDPAADAWRPLRPRAPGSHVITLAPGRYLVRLDGPKLRREDRPVEIGARDVHLDLHAIGKAHDRVRISGHRLPLPMPPDRYDAFLAPGADGLRLVGLLLPAARLGFRLDAERATDSGLRRVARLLAAFTPEARDPIALANPAPRLDGRLREALAAMPPAEISQRSSAVLPLVAFRAITPDDLAALRALPDVIAAGRSLRAEPDHPAVRRPALDLRLAPGASPQALLAAVGRRWAEVLRRARPDAGPHAIAGHVRVELPPTLDDELEDLADDLLATGLVLYAEPRIAERAALLDDGLDVDAARQWDLARIEVDAAHAALASAGRRPGGGVRVAVIDEGIALLGGQIVHPDLSDRVTLLRADGTPGGHDHVYIGHGGSVAALVAATEHDGAGAGMRGVAPAAALDAFAFNAAAATAVADVFRVAGLDRPKAPPADVIVFAMLVDGIRTDAPPPPANMQPGLAGVGPDVFEMAARRGRAGRGCVIVLAAGNEGAPLTTRNPLATSPHVLTVGATDLVGESETFARASNHGAGVDCAAPGYRGGAAQTFSVHPAARERWPAESLLRGTVTAIDGGVVTVAFDSAARADALAVPRGARVVFGGLDRARTLWTVAALLERDPAGAWIQVAVKPAPLYATPPHDPITTGATADFADLRRATFVAAPVDGRARISALLPTGTRWVTLAHPTSTVRRAEVVLASQGTSPATLARIANFAPATATSGFPPGTEVWVSASGHDERFGQTSAASALAAGVAALVLSANPALTATEARQLIIDSGEPIADQPDRDPARRYPRIDARRAVEAALAYDHPRDLGFESPATGDPSPESDDLWTRAAAYRDGEPVFAPFSGLDATAEPLAPGGWICARLRNLGPSAASLPAAVRFYLAALPDDGVFTWPRDFAAGTGYSGVALTAGSYLLGEVEIPAGIAPGAARIVQIPWPAWATPTAASPWERHLLVEVTPHDGPRIGATIAENPNLARRRLAFAGDAP